MQRNVLVLKKQQFITLKTGMNKYVNEYKSLIGFVFQSRYSYYDYLNGGMALLKKNHYLKKIVSLDNIQDIIVAYKYR